MSTEERLDRIERLLVIGFKKVLNVAELALYLGLSESRIRHMVMTQEIPSYKQKGKVYFNKDEIEKHLLSNRRPSLTEIKSKAVTRLTIGRIK